MSVRLPRPALCGLLLLASAGSDPDPFAAGERWVWSPPDGAPAIPSSVALAASGDLVWVASKGAAGVWDLFESPGFGTGGERSPLHGHTAPHELTAPVRAVATTDPGRFFGLRQEPLPPAGKRTVVTRHDALAASRGAGFAPSWEHAFETISAGPAHMDADRHGAQVIAALLDTSRGEVRAVWLDGETGEEKATVVFPALTLDTVRVSSDGDRVAIAAGVDVYVFDSAGELVEHIVRDAATPALAWSAAGRILVVGGSSTVEVWVQRPGGYRQLHSIPGGSADLPLRVALSAAGDRMAVAWWNRFTGVEVRLEAWDLAPPIRLFQHVQAGAPGGLQNYPAALEMTPQGDRVALGTWGLGGAEPEVALFEATSGEELFEVDLPGSVRDLDLDPTGTRIAVVHKDDHANRFASTGATRLFDTGERRFVLTAPPRLGERVEVAARRAGARRVLFLVGLRSASPTTIGGASGKLFLDPAGMRVFARSADSTGRADLSLPIPDDPVWLGTPWSLQVAFRTGGATELGEVVDPTILGD